MGGDVNGSGWQSSYGLAISDARGRDTAASATGQPEVDVVVLGRRLPGEVGGVHGTLWILACGLLGGFALGVVARAWMRLISEEPEFTWIGTLPLFGAAGALMIPTVIGGGLARARVDWRKTTRGVLCLVAVVPVVVVAHDLVVSFGWSAHAVFGFVGLLAVYAAVIWATQFTFAPQLDGWRLPRWVRWTVPVVAAIVVVIPLYFGGIE